MKKITKKKQQQFMMWFSMFSAVFFITVLMMMDGDLVKASVPQTHQEWLKPMFHVEHQQQKIRVEKVKSGDVAAMVLRRLGFPAAEANQIVVAARPVYSLRKIYAGKTITRTDQGDVITLLYDVSAEQQLRLTSSSQQAWVASLEDKMLSTRTLVVEGTIQDSLFLDAAKAGLEDKLTLKLVDIFAWDIDFARDLRKGDSFKVLFEETFDTQGKRVRYNILAAEFQNRGYSYKAVRYQNQAGSVEYYNQEGKNLRKTYLKSPVKYSRISSRFSNARKHPVLGYTRAHRGVDYAAKSGTPIRAIGDGKIAFKGWKGGYGRFIEIRHNNGIHSTAYAHMRRYASGMRKGRFVRQGQVIGYVGMSGLATGPHLHFEFRSRGRAVNPLKVKHKPANPVAKQELTAFRVHAKNLLNIMQQQSQAQTWG
ncbi:MAG: peptidoglycan DD-metalloendopeptidase family protein [Mariprofundaceae bacterium]|nr:peptidoglycan DD-metalloendopeptidase family protein [Mariprofundaceae bacterium]